MKRFNLSGPQDFMALLVRRKYWVLFPFLALSCAAVLLTYMLPKMYVSQSLILIRPRDISDDFVKNLIEGSTEQRLSGIRQTVFSRKNLLLILREYGDQITEYQNLNLDEKVAKLGTQINVVFNVGDTVGNGRIPLTYFQVSYPNRNPEIAQKVTAKVTELFIEEDTKTRESQISGNTEFLSGELEKIGSQLNDSDTKLKILKGSRRNSLPDQLPSVIATLTRLTDNKKAYLEAVDRASGELSRLERDISEIPATITTAKQASGTSAQTVSAPNPKLEEYRRARIELSALKAKGYTDSFIDVVLVTRQLERLQKEIPPDELASLDKKEEKPAVSTPLVETMPNPVYQRLVDRRDELKNEINIRINAIKANDAEIVQYEKWVKEEPQSAQDIGEITRQNDDLKKQYQVMKDKLSEAQLSESLETKQKGSQFVVMDPANLPLSPSKPMKPAIAGVGVMISLLAGLVFAVAVDIANQKMWTLSDVETLLNTTVLVEIPEIVTATDIAATRKKRRAYVASLAAISAAYAVCLYFVYVHQGFVLAHLDPLLKRLY